MKVKKLLKENTEKVLHTKVNGDKLVVNDSGHGYSAYTKNNVHIGHIEAETDAEAVAEFSKKEPKYESMDNTPAGWKRDDKTLNNRYTYWDNDFFASASISNSMSDPKNIVTIIQILDKHNPDNCEEIINHVRVNDVTIDFETVLLDTVRKADEFLSAKKKSTTESLRIHNESMKEDYLDSAEFRIQRYEDEIPELFHKVHDGYMSGMVNAKAYADALATIFSALDEIDYDAGSIQENLETEEEQDIGNGELIGRIENGKFNVYQGEDIIGSFDSQADAEDSGYNVFENLSSTYKTESIEDIAVIEDTDELMNTLKKLVKKYDHMMLVNPIHCKIFDDNHGRRLDISPETTVMESSKCSTRIEEAKEESNLPESSDIENDSSHQTKIEDIEFVMMEYINSDFGVDFVKKITPTTYQVCYNDEVVTLEFDPDWPEYVYTIEGKGPHAHRSYEFIISDIQDYIAQYRNEYDDDYDDLSSFGEDYEVRRANTLYGVAKADDFEEDENLDESYVDTNGILGISGYKYSKQDLKRIWDKGKDSDPCMADYKGDYDAWLRDTISHLSNDNMNESSRRKIKVGNYVTHIDDNPPTRGVVVKVDGDMATVQVGDPAKKDYVDVPLNKLQLDEDFDRRSNINLFMVGVKVSNLLGVDALGEDDWIEFDCGDVRDVVGGELHMPFEAIGEDKELRGSMMTNKGRIDVRFRNGSEAKCDTPEEIARFVAGEFGISL